MKGINYVITAQSEHENWQAVKSLCDGLQIKHFHIDLNGANQALLGNQVTIKYLESRLKELFQILAGDETCVLHCAAGIHRTGTMAYTLLRMSGYSEEESFSLLGTMREETKKGVGDWRIEIAERKLLPHLV
jgi:protein tyrosine/serine phosphatase